MADVSIAEKLHRSKALSETLSAQFSEASLKKRVCQTSVAEIHKVNIFLSKSGTCVNWSSTYQIGCIFQRIAPPSNHKYLRLF